MLGLETALRLPMSFDPDRLVGDLEALQNVPALAHYGPYHNGGWKGVALIAHGGRFDELRTTPEPARETELLDGCPYFKEVIDRFLCGKKRVRLLTLLPGGRIEEHRDPVESIDFGLARLHIPVVTNSQVILRIAKRRYYWNPGELWYGDFSFPHSVENRSSIARVHMVLDLEVNDFVLNLFPKDYFRYKRWRAAYREWHCNWYWYLGRGRSDWLESRRNQDHGLGKPSA